MPRPAEPETPPAAAADAGAAPVFVNTHKHRSGLARVLSATGHSLAGLRAAWDERAFRLESACALLLLPAALWLGQGWVERVLLAGTVLIVLIVELLNSGIEAAVDRIGPQWHALSKRAKDLGSAAVMLSLVLCGATWASAFVARFSGG